MSEMERSMTKHWRQVPTENVNGFCRYGGGPNRVERSKRTETLICSAGWRGALFSADRAVSEGPPCKAASNPLNEPLQWGFT